MSNEDEIEIPDAWRRALHPRRGGMAAFDEPRSDKSMAEYTAQLAARGIDLDAERERILNHPDSDRTAVNLARSDEASVAADGVRLALAPSPYRETFWIAIRWRPSTSSSPRAV